MIITTTNDINGKEVKEYIGIVTGEAIVGAHVFKDIFAGMRDFFGGRSKAYETTIRDARDIALREMQEEAEKLGAHAILGVDIDYEVLGKTGSMLMASATGTAVILR